MIESPYATQFTRTGEPDYTNRKPYRSKRLKDEARKNHWRDDRGIYHSSVPTLVH